MAVLGFCLAVPAGAVSIATIGDSYTDNYNPARYKHRSWTDQVAANPSIGVDFGAGQTLNIAVSGATTAAAVSNQLPQVISKLGQADYVVIDVGLNDLHGNTQHPDGWWRPDRYIAIGNGNTALRASVTNSVVNNIKALINGIRAADPNKKVILATIPDWGATISFRRKVKDFTYHMDFSDTGSKANKNVRATFTAMMRDINGQISDYALDRGIPVVDKFKLLNRAKNEPTIAFTKTKRLNTRFHPGYRNTEGGAYAMWADGMHPGTGWQGLYANLLLYVIRDVYGEDIDLLTARQIMSTYAGGATLPNDDVHPGYKWWNFVDLPDAQLLANPASAQLALETGLTLQSLERGRALAPEPTSGALLLLAAGALMRRTRRSPSA